MASILVILSLRSEMTQEEEEEQLLLLLRPAFYLRKGGNKRMEFVPASAFDLLCDDKDKSEGVTGKKKTRSPFVRNPPSLSEIPPFCPKSPLLSENATFR